MKKLLLLSLGALICFSVYSQKNDLILFKLPDKKQTIKIKPGAWINFYQNSYTPDSLAIYKSITGRLDFAQDDSITVMVEEINTRFQLESELIKNVIITGKERPYKAFKSASYPLSSVNTLRYQNKSGEVFTKIGSYLIVASLVTLAAVAPLVSIDYKTGEFNMDTYKSVLIAGGIGFGVSIPILIFSSKKYVHLDKSKSKCVKKFYTHIKPL